MFKEEMEMENKTKVTWKDEIIEAMKSLGGHARYEDLYNEIEARGNIDFSVLKDPRAQIRGTIEKFSSDSQVHNIKDDDIFYSVEGIGSGHWGLRNFEPHDKDVDITDDDSGFPEGKKKLREHVCRERNQQVIKIAKQRFKEKYGRVFCEACGFDFEKTYGEIGEDFIEAHHNIPVSELKEGDVTRPSDISLLCSCCHRMAHRKRPWLNATQLKELLNNR